MTSLIKSSGPVSHIRLAFLLIVLGLMFALDSILGIPIIYKLWPLIVSFLSLGFLGIFIKRKRRDPVFISIGVYLLCFSILALFCNFTSWNSLSYLWPLFILFMGVAFLSIFLFNKRSKTILLTGAIFSLLSLLFFLFSTNNSQYWWTVLILAGLSILITEKAS